MPITNETIMEANRSMLGKTNRSILFAKVNLDEYLDPDALERDREYTPSLGSLLSRVEEMSEEQFLSLVRENLTVTSFTEFLDKFQPGFYYRVRGPQMAQAVEGDGDAPPPHGGGARPAADRVLPGRRGRAGRRSASAPTTRTFAACAT